MAATDDRIYIAVFGRPAGIKAYTHDFGAVVADDTTYQGSDISRGGLGWNGRALISGAGGTLYFYGSAAPEPEPEPPPVVVGTPGIIGVPRGPIQQYYGFQRWEQRFDVLRKEADQSVTVVALNVPGVQQTATQFVEVASPVTIQEQLRDVAWVPRVTIPQLEIGDTVLLHQGLAEDEITEIPPDADVTITGIIQHGGITQYVNLSRPEPPAPDPGNGNGNGDDG